MLVQSEGAFMKRKVATIFFAGGMVCMAGTVSYSVPVLMVRNDEQVAIPGSGMLTRCPFSFVETPHTTPVRVSVIEDSKQFCGLCGWDCVLGGGV